MEAENWNRQDLWFRGERRKFGVGMETAACAQVDSQGRILFENHPARGENCEELGKRLRIG